jgi:hypothetical protein
MFRFVRVPGRKAKVLEIKWAYGSEIGPEAGTLHAGLNIGSCGSHPGSPTIEGFGRVGEVELVPIVAAAGFMPEVRAAILRESFALLFSVWIPACIIGVHAWLARLST